ncbi:DUF3108 domain-containing protein [Oceanimonas baumannii]|uniref:Uncharacterized protein DUF3108 n=1 Tax=Oceanimonas baumannii TaxID=129578 RepID=A0A235CMP3_9GAMM|nr:DUF3108 domain-containing protein [Oceanimonas baumannii]MCC4263250.1 DUF3108 domain-containing protein [Oceanimonas baumannii]OYD25841.1 hypothetical protein B6S09_03100 [Oceanimonas baumannii]TDW60144.1 uncharacterized protein DUF3108 [Oceanimonas baumannii]
MLQKCLLALTGLLLASAATARDIDHMRAEFSVMLNGDATKGVNTLSIDRNRDQYHVHFSLRHWLLDVDQKASFTWHDCTASPETFSYKAKALGVTREERLVFDKGTDMLLYQDKDGDKLLSAEGGVFDPVSFFFEARCDLIAGKQAFEYKVARDGEIKSMPFKVVGTQALKTGIGTLDTLIVERDRGNSKRKTRFWVAPELDYLLVQISHEENRQLAVTATLSKMDYRLADEG